MPIFTVYELACVTLKISVIVRHTLATSRGTKLHLEVARVYTALCIFMLRVIVCQTV